MEREQSIQRRPTTAGGGDEGSDLEETRRRLSGLHSAADEALRAITPGDAEEYLQQGRQQGAE